MQIYCIRLKNFCRFSDKNNSIVFDILPEYKESGILDLDLLYDQIKNNPLEHIKKVKQNGTTNLATICGYKNGNYSFSNGTGKSTILEGIVYCLFEQVIKHTKNNDKTEKVTTSIITKINGSYPKDVTEAYVEIIFEENGKVYILKRGRELSKNKQNHTKLLEFVCVNEDNELDSHSGHRTMDTEESLAKVINISYDLFVNSVMFGQMDMGKFLSGTDQTRKEMLIELLRFDSLLNGMLEKTRSKKNAKQTEIDRCNAQILLMSESLQKKTPIDQLQNRIISFEKNISDCVITEEKLRKELNILNKSDIIKELESIKSDGVRVKTDLNAKRKDKERTTKEWIDLSNDTEKTISNKVSEIVLANKKKETASAKLLSIEKFVGSFNIEAKKKDLETIDKAKNLKPKIDAAIKEHLDTKEKIYGIITTLESDVVKYSKEIKMLTDQIQIDADSFKCNKCKSMVSRSHIEQEISKNEKEKTITEQEISKNKDVHNKCVKDLQETRDKMLKIEGWIAKESYISSEIKDFENSKEKANELKAVLDENTILIGKLEQEKKDAESKKTHYVTKVSEISKSYDEEISILETKLKELTYKYKDVESSATSIRDNMARIQMALDEKAKLKNQSNSEIGSIKKEIEGVEEDNKKLLDLRAKFESDSVILRRLETLDTCLGLGGIQVRIIKKYLPLLNVYIEEFIKVLSGGTMGVKIDIDEKGKVIVIISGDSADNYEMSSGGEETIIKMAVSVGMALLSFTRCNQKPEFIGIDEVFASLDPSHIDMVFHLLNKLKEKFSRIVVISHSPLINDRISNKIMVEKDEGALGRSKIIAVT